MRTVTAGVRLKNGNWAQDVKFCAWNEVAYDGKVSLLSFKLTFPGVPSSRAAMSNELGALTGFQVFRVSASSDVAIRRPVLYHRF
ncbi:hypothetical protein BC629DRAFT_1587457 [Irpex lacteus]|nr:hypothetical protein BC629DRAFT_1587457 [Irpex lacteus]